jgi:hypothetical protein
MTKRQQAAALQSPLFQQDTNTKGVGQAAELLAVLALERSLARNIRDEIYASRNIPVTLGMLYFWCAATRSHH